MNDTLELVRYAVRLAVDDGYRANEISAAVHSEFQRALKAADARRRVERSSARGTLAA